MKGVTISQKDGPLIVVERPLPRVRPGYILVKTIAVALNPADALYLSMGLVEPGCLIGCDYAGIVQEVGPGVRRRFMEGDRVCGCTRPADANEPENGAFAEVICVKADIQLHVPDFLSFEEAAAFGVAVLTTGRAFVRIVWLSLSEAY